MQYRVHHWWTTCVLTNPEEQSDRQFGSWPIIYLPCHRSSLCAAVHYTYVHIPVVLATFSPSLQLHSRNWLLSGGIWEYMVHLSYTLANIQHSNIQPIPLTSFKKFMDFLLEPRLSGGWDLRTRLGHIYTLASILHTSTHSDRSRVRVGHPELHMCTRHHYVVPRGWLNAERCGPWLEMLHCSPWLNSIAAPGLKCC